LFANLGEDNAVLGNQLKRTLAVLLIEPTCSWYFVDAANDNFSIGEIHGENYQLARDPEA
jgi:hypothetical protein